MVRSSRRPLFFAAPVLLLVLLLLLLGGGARPGPAAAAAASPSSLSLKPPTRRYVVLVKPGADPKKVAADHRKRLKAGIRYVYRRAVRGYSASLPPGRVAALARDPRVEAVEPDHRMTANAAAVPWSLDRLDQRALPLDGRFTPPGDGAGVTVYVIDSGIRTSHKQFGGRAKSGFDAVDGGRANDCNGHGTHVAATIGGSNSGVARAAKLVAVRVLDCAGNGDIASVIAGVEWITAHHKPGTPAVANISLGGLQSTALDRAVSKSIASGVTYVVAAGNDGGDACRMSPARVKGAITVSATDQHDVRPGWADWGECVDLFAPGVGIRSAWGSSDTAVKALDGTSMAAPHAAGAAAVWLGLHPAASPRSVASALKSAATPGVVGDARVPKPALLYLGP